VISELRAWTSLAPKYHTDLLNLTFTYDDVHNLGNYGVFDVVFCCGVLYHLDAPRKLSN
jgi:2-polyprenyl-3-methyl-5-hydroxy-6-metoxy-1,4-benzoquinol methylase